MLTDPNRRATTVKKPGRYRNQCCLLKSKRSSLKILKTILEAKTVAPIPLSSIPNNITNKNNNNNYKNSNRAERKAKPFYPTCETYGKTNQSTEKCYYGTNAANRPPPRHRRPENRVRSKKEPTRTTQMKLLKLQPKI